MKSVNSLFQNKCYYGGAHAHQCKRYASCSLGYLRFKVTCVADVNFGVLQLCNYPQV